MTAAKRKSRDELAQETRQALIDAGMNLLREQPAGNVFSHLKAPVVSERAGVTTGAFFHHFATQSDYLDSLLEHGLSAHRDIEQPAMQAAAALLAEGATFRDLVMKVCRINQEILPQDPLFHVRLLIAAGNDKYADLVKDNYALLDADAAELYTAMVALLGREFRPPYTAESAAVLLGAVVEGLAVRQLVTPAMVHPDMFGHALLSMMDMLTRPVGDNRDVGTWTEDEALTWPEADPGK